MATSTDPALSSRFRLLRFGVGLLYRAFDPGCRLLPRLAAALASGGSATGAEPT